MAATMKWVPYQRIYLRVLATARPATTPQPSHPYHMTSPQPPFRATILRRKTRAQAPNQTRKRTLFGVGDIIQVITNPADTLRSLTEARRLLEEARQEISENRERAQLRPSHTFSRLPGFFPRPEELQAVERALEEEPCFTVLFGASSVGKTALLRQLLSSEKYHVLHFDLRIAGFADLESLYISLSQQMEQYFAAIAEAKGYEEFEKEAWGFKHDRRCVEQRLERSAGQIRTSDIARLLELFQSSLLKYRQFVPKPDADGNGKESETTQASISAQSNRNRSSPWWRFGRSSAALRPARENAAQGQSEPKAPEAPAKRIPVFFLDEAHRLPGLIQSTEAMKVLLDSMLVLTKQDRLCHIIHATSDPFYQTWLRQLNVMQHCKIITIGDCTKLETRSFYERRLLPRVPAAQRAGLDFERLYEAFGGRLVHWQDFITDYVNSGGRLEVHHSSHFIQAHALLNLHIIHSSHLADIGGAGGMRSRRNSTAPNPRHSTVNIQEPAPGGASGGGFPIYTPRNLNANVSTTTLGPGYTSDFSAVQLLRIMSRLTQPGTRTLSYFMLCREFGVRAIDGMVRGRILDLRWMDPVTDEDEPEALAMSPEGFSRTLHPEGGIHMGTSRNSMGIPSRSSVGLQLNASHSGTAIAGDFVDVEQELAGLGMREGGLSDEGHFGPKIMPASPILRYAMASVVAEYEDTGSASEYASLSDVDEY